MGQQESAHSGEHAFCSAMAFSAGHKQAVWGGVKGLHPWKGESHCLQGRSEGIGHARPGFWTSSNTPSAV